MTTFKEGSWEAAAMEAAGSLQVRPWNTPYNMEQLWGFAYVTDTDLDWPIPYLAARAKDGFYRLSDMTLREMVLKLAEKQHEYGPLNILKFKQEGLKIRTWDKIARINNLVGKCSDGVVEPLADAYYDIWGYCVLHRMLRDGTFELPLEATMVSAETVVAEDNIIRYGDRIKFTNGDNNGWTVERA